MARDAEGATARQHLTSQDDRVVAIEDRWQRMVAGTPWVASCTVLVDQVRVETCSVPEAIEFLTYGALGDSRSWARSSSWSASGPAPAPRPEPYGAVEGRGSTV